ncbi:MAG: site-2 protease family protein [Candidatus Peregrinibacteria bacterium]
MNSIFLQPTFLIAILLSISVHESAHAWVAKKLGDYTAALQGRISLNPLAHLDMMGALCFLIVGFGWAKPVPVNPFAFRHRKLDNALVALAGPLSNFLLGLLSFIALALLQHATSNPFGLLSATSTSSVLMTFLVQLLGSFVFLNFGLMAFNLLPIAPLDGSKILEPFIPYHLEERYEAFMRAGPMILIIALLAESFLGISLISGWVFGIERGVLMVLSSVFAFL